MEVGARVTSENLITGEKKHTSSAYLTFVALGDDGKPKKAPEFIAEGEDEVRRWKQAEIRRRQRLQAKKELSEVK